MHKETRNALIATAAITLLLIVGFSLSAGTTQTIPADSLPVVIENGVQIITVTAKAGYAPRQIVAEAGVPTELRMVTRGTYDCSSSLVIPKLGYQKLLPPTGTETITIPADQASGTLDGRCSMGMYAFNIEFR